MLPLFSDSIPRFTIPHRSALVLPLFFGSVSQTVVLHCSAWFYVEEVRARLVTVKNQRRAYMKVFIRGEKYFSEDAMWERELYLHYLFLGRFQDLSGRAMSRPGERWLETLMRRCKEAMLVEKIQGE